MKKCIFVFIALEAFALGANHYVLQSASGAATGNNWTDALTTMPSSYTRGDTYYVGTGTYSTNTSPSTADSGTTAITVKGATIADHGTATGWSNSFSVCSGEGGTQAQFSSGWALSTDYWTIDGACGGGSANNGTTTGYGFRTRSDASGNGGIGFAFANTVVGITISHYEIDGVDCCDIPAGTGGTDAMLCTGRCQVSGQIDHVYAHDIKRTFMLMGAGSSLIVDHVYYARNRSTPAQHAEAWSTGGGTPTVRYSIIEDYRGTGGYVGIGGSTTNAQFYGNVFRVVQGACSGCDDGAQPVIDDTSGTIVGLKFYNNTIYGIAGNSGIGCVGASSGYDLQNNLWYGNTYGASYGCISTMQYNLIWNTYPFGGPGSNGTDGSHNQYICGSNSNCTGAGYGGTLPPTPATVFASAPSNLHVNGETVSGNYCSSPCSLGGTSLSAPYNVDMDGNTRGADGTWTIGAYQFPSASNAGGSSRGGAFKSGGK